MAQVELTIKVDVDEFVKSVPIPVDNETARPLYQTPEEWVGFYITEYLKNEERNGRQARGNAEVAARERRNEDIAQTTRRAG